MKSMELDIVIDEAGQLITQGDAAKRNKYFAIGACIYPKDKEEDAENVINEAKSKIEYKKEILHFNEIRNHGKKVNICRYIGTSSKVLFFGVISNKETLGDYAEYIGSDYSRFYNKCLMYLFERIGSALHNISVARNVSIIPDIFIEEINIDISKTKNYLEICKNNPIREPTKFLENFDFEKITMASKKEKKTLQLADIMASSLFSCANNARAPGGEPRYIYELRKKIYGYKSKSGLLKNGIYAIHKIDDLNLDSYSRIILKNLHKL